MEGRLVEQLLALGVTALLFASICYILRARASRFVLLACLFVTLLVSTQLSMKVLASPPYSYKFPGLVTTLHFICVSCVCFGYWTCWRREPWRCWPGSIGWRRWLRTSIPIALSTPLAILFNNKAMVLLGAGLVAIIGTLSPVVTAVLSRAMGNRLSLLSWLGVLVAFVGGGVISWGELTQVQSQSSTEMASNVIPGLSFALIAVLGRAAKIVLMDLLISPSAYADGEDRQEEALSPVHVLTVQYPLTALVSLVYSVSTEDVAQGVRQLSPATTGVVACTCLSAVALSFSGMPVLKELGASYQQIIGKLNTLCIAAISVAFLGERLPAPVVLGSCLVLSGVAIFERGALQHHGASAAGESEESEEDSENGYDGDSVSPTASPPQKVWPAPR